GRGNDAPHHGRFRPNACIFRFVFARPRRVLCGRLPSKHDSRVSHPTAPSRGLSEGGSPIRRSLSIMSAAAGVGLLSGVALPSHTEPAKAQKAEFALVNGFLPCFTPNTATQSDNNPACAPAVPGFCAFTSSGSGKVTLSKSGSVSAGNE